MPGGFGGIGNPAGGGGVEAGAAGMLEGGGGGKGLPERPGGLGGIGSLPGGGGGTESLPGGGSGAEGRDGADGALGAEGNWTGILIREVEVAFSGRLMRMVSCLTSALEGRLMRMVSFFISGVCSGRVMRMVSLRSVGEAPGFGGRVMRTVAFLVGLESGVAGGVSSAIKISRKCISLGERGVNLGKVRNFCLLEFFPFHSLRR